MSRDELRAWWETPLGREHFLIVLSSVLSEDELEDLMEWASDPRSMPRPVELIRRVQALIED